ncbi:alpha-glucosidase [Tessaracoccus rhinocerotis]|uniref:Alpha-glucosidase n=1 Tax=Tessaracoccus rhinocerotis TaxID=1689449 RepID=A0A553K0B0_9ACTN|nr:alpha-glucosidase [Tessaracoccus rhinocerotis]TRY18134.1 alpha-glucosidase [Tessaracoccus rhinocerotis]
MHPLTERSQVRDVLKRPLGRDVIDKLLLQLGRSSKWVTNPLVSRMRLDQLEAIARPVVGDGFVSTLLELLNELPDPNPITHGEPTPTWWKQAVFYQVYPRSFADSDDDGMGDVRGIINHLDHIADLGVDCLWLSPIFASPDLDNGYDISDYRAVMPEMGTLDDVDELIRGCHERGMRLILDLVVNHTSDEHEWFREARQDPDGKYGQYYFLRGGDPPPADPPNNWTSFFSGPAWRWLEDAERWALHLFANGQLDLNWDNPEVRDEVADIVQWWLARGIDGFRLDVINYISKREGLPDGNEFVGQLMEFRGVEHYFHGPHLHEYLAELRRNGFTRRDVPPDSVGPGRDAVAVMIGETPGIGIEVGRLLTAEDRGEMDLIFNFDVLEPAGRTRWHDYRYPLSHLKSHLVEYQSRLGSTDWMSLFVENHDNPRMISKVEPDPQYRTAVGKAIAAIQLLSRGTPFIYQGQEIAAVNQDFPDALALRDVESVNRLAEAEVLGRDGLVEVMAGSRDHARTPMRWDNTPNYGFTGGEPWIGFHEDSTGFTVAEQEADPESVLNFYRGLIRMRRRHKALTMGSVRFVEPDRPDWFGWYREYVDPDTGERDRWFIQVNLTRHRVLPPTSAPGPLRLLAPYEVRILQQD